ncbi:RNA 2',3'-cyclic phosphodiesterase [Pseudonocardia charpentierae]|uniref:RNA 2',3'-cyclic phosphodiesterase n=1 Tax=Pseudonocardia charpentierae TaxID=3075545 RepID=A0ABU2NAA0_9PSEU|nr:RNA 2',3'-cyclic phosphodiesterase [Pseudonocardia sp. DSM 45834]MDT0350867.1 RNA 2',3'-cyclic phosphodiesterase [Pseudonocardia sp. DSM 45834]
MRAFVALVPPASALAELAAALAPVQAADPGLRWTPPGQWHLTLAFLGDIEGDGLDDGVLPALAERLARAARRHPPTELALGGGGRFGDRVLWIRVHDLGADARRGHTGVRGLAGSVGAVARRCGIPVDDRPYRPHLTLARARPGSDLRPAVDALKDFTGTPWTADALHLVRSRLGAGPGGTAAHDVIATWRLGTQDTRG